ncbi:MAG: hypothetical protein NC124_02215 [Clostridium sp.]|nr:hypothetical protein [Clostridium sp.]
MAEKNGTAIYETLGALSSDVKNLNQRFIELAGAFNRISDALIEIKESQKKIEQLEKKIETQNKESKDQTILVLEQFGLAFDHREEIRKDLAFLEELRNTKKKFISSFVSKIAEWMAVGAVATYVAPKIMGM